jgi:tetratricopeptide (TPR) repeat protein
MNIQQPKHSTERTPGRATEREGQQSGFRSAPVPGRSNVVSSRVPVPLKTSAQRTMLRPGPAHSAAKSASRFQSHPTVRFCLALVVLLGFVARGVAADVASDFDIANKLYEQGKFPEAAAAYQRLLQSGNVSSAIYFNLGNAFFKAGEAGRAVAAYRAAEAIAPRDPEVRANLQFVRSRVQSPAMPDPAWRAWLGRLTLDEWTILASALFWVSLILFAAQQFRPSWKTALRSISMIAAGAALAAAVCLAIVWRHAATDRMVVVTAETVTARTGPFDEAQSAFVVHDGAELEVVDQKDQWVQARANARQIGWLRRADVEQLMR